MKKTQKGFTLVELLVVIAIIAILATVSIIGYTSFVEKAKESNDSSLVKQLNTAVLRADGKDYANMHEVAERLRAQGFDLSKMEATAKNHSILWDMDAQEFFYAEDGDDHPANVWIVDDEVSADYNTYYIGGDINTELTATIVLATASDAVINIYAPNAEITHYGEAHTINLVAVAPNTYVENGAVEQINVAQGRVVLGSTAVVTSVVIEETSKEVKVELSAGSTTAAVIVNDAEAKVDVAEGASVEAIAPGRDELVSAMGTIAPNAPADVVVNEVVVPPVAGEFAGGLGTAKSPFIIATPEHLVNIGNYYDTYKYYKVADGVTSLDLTGLGKINLNGSFDGNGVTIVNLTTALFERVGYQNQAADIKISNITATVNTLDGRGFVRNIFNSGKTTFENITLHGYIEGLYNMGSFYNYGTANYDDTGASYTVEFINSKSDISLVCTSGNGIGGMIGHGFEGAGNSITIIKDDASAYTGTMYTTNGSTCGDFMYMSSNGSKFMLNGEQTSCARTYPSTKITSVLPTVGADGYYVVPVAGAAKLVVYVNTQVTAYEGDEKVANLNGLTWPLGNFEITEGLDGKLFDLVTSATIVNGTDHEFGYEIANGALTIYSARSDNYCEGPVRLQVNQYDANGNLLATGTIQIAEVVR